jgi:hypothetical protein
MELRFVEGNFEHGRFKLQYRYDIRDSGSTEWRDVPCVKEETKRVHWCEHMTHESGYWLLKKPHHVCVSMGIDHSVKFCPLCGAKRPVEA